MNFGTVASPIGISYGGSGEASSKYVLFRICRHRQASRLFIVGLRNSNANFAPCACWRIGETNSALDSHGGGNWVSTRRCRRFRVLGFSARDRNQGPQVLLSAKAQDVLLCEEASLQATWHCVKVRTPSKMMTEMDDVMVYESRLPYPKDLDESVLAARAREMQEVVLENGVFENSVVDSPVSGAMMTEMDDPMVLESRLPYLKDLDMIVLAARAREMQKVVLENGVFEISAVDSPASGAMEITAQVVGMETSPPALATSLVGDDMSKPGDGAQSEAAEVNIGCELPVENLPSSCRISGNVNDIAGGGIVVTQKKRRNRGKDWAEKDTEELLKAVSTTKKACTRMVQGTAIDSYWDAIAKAVPGRTGDECRRRMDTLKKFFSTTTNYCERQLKEFKQLNEKDFSEMKVSPLWTEEWYNQIREYCPPTPKKKLKSNGGGSSSKNSAFALDSSTSGLEPPALGEPALVDPPASQLELPVADPLQQQAPPASPPWFDRIEDYSVPLEQVIPAPSLPRYDFIEELDEAWKLFDSSV